MKKFLTSIFIAASAISAHAAEYTPENKVIQVVIPYQSTSGLGALYLHMEDYAKRQNITMVPVYKSGATGKIGIDYASKQKNNGDVLLFSTISDIVETNNAGNFDGVALLTKAPMILVASKKSEIKTIADIVNIEKKTPGKLNWAHTTSVQLSLINGIADANDIDKTKMTNITYSGVAGTYLTAIVSGEVDLAFVLSSTVARLSNQVTVVDIDNKTKKYLERRENATALFLPKNSNPEANKFWNNFTKGLLNDVKFKTILDTHNIQNLSNTSREDLNKIIVNWKM